MPRFILLFLLICLVVFAVWHFGRDPRVQQSLQRIGKSLLIIAGVVFGALAIRALPYLAALLPLLLPVIIRRFSQGMGPTKSGPFGGGPFSQKGSATAPSESKVNTAFFEMTLDHDSGHMYGTVLSGKYAGSSISDLGQSELITLWHECQSDPQSLAVLESYLQRVFPDWKDHISNYGEPGTSENISQRQEALAILGLSESADKNQIKEAHRRLIQRLHPDQGGSDYLASRINWAKDTLMN